MLILSCLLGLASATGRIFSPVRDGRISSASNYKDGVIPCEGDGIIFPRDTAVVATFDQTTFITEMVLPDNGILYLADNMELGKENKWQCPHKSAKHNATYKPQNLTVFNASSWQTDYAYKLDINSVPGPIDCVTFDRNSSVRLILNGDLTVSSWVMDEKEWTTKELAHLMKTKEGELLIENKGRHSIEVLGRHVAHLFGEINPNARNETHRLLCGRPCPPLHCINEIQAFGACCPDCGALLTVKTLSMPFIGLKQRVQHFHDLMNTKYKDAAKNLQTTVERLDIADTFSYQIFVYDNSSSSPFPEELFADALYYLKRTVNIEGDDPHGYVILQERVSTRDHTFRRSSILKGTCFSFGLLFLILLVRSERVISLIRGSQSTLRNWKISFKREEDEVLVEEEGGKEKNEASEDEKNEPNTVSFDNVVFKEHSDDEDQPPIGDNLLL